MNKKTTVGIILAIAVIAIAIGLGVYYTSDTYKYRYCSVLYLEKEARSKLGDGVCDYATNGNPNEIYNANKESCGWDFGELSLCVCVCVLCVSSLSVLVFTQTI